MSVLPLDPFATWLDDRPLGNELPDVDVAGDPFEGDVDWPEGPDESDLGGAGDFDDEFRSIYRRVPRARRVAVADDASTELVLSARICKDNGAPRKFKLILQGGVTTSSGGAGAGRGAYLVNVYTGIDNIDYKQTITVYEGQSQSIQGVAESLRVDVTYIGQTPNTGQLEYRLDFDLAGSSTYMTQTEHVGTGSAFNLVPPPLAHDFTIYYLVAEDPFTLTYYNGDNQVIANFNSATGNNGDNFRVNRLGRMTIDKTTGERFTVVWRCHG